MGVGRLAELNVKVHVARGVGQNDLQEGGCMGRRAGGLGGWHGHRLGRHLVTCTEGATRGGVSVGRKRRGLAGVGTSITITLGWADKLEWLHCLKH